MRAAASSLLGCAVVTVTAAQDEAAPQVQASTAGEILCRETDERTAVCAVDREMYVGRIVYSRHCASCHGADAEGSAFAPSLARRLAQFDAAQFRAAMYDGYTGPRAPLAPWASEREVAAQLELLWAFLKARADGRLPAAQLEAR